MHLISAKLGKFFLIFGQKFGNLEFVAKIFLILFGFLIDIKGPPFVTSVNSL